MKKIFIFSILLFLPILSNAQIGIGTSSPTATLDVVAANISGATTNVDGVLIPRVNRSRAQSMVGTPISTIIYVNEVITGTSAGTTVNVTTVGFYFFNGSTWEKLVTGTSTDWSTLGNSGLIGTTNFIGTVDDVDVSFRRNNLAAGKIGTNSTSFGVGALTSGGSTNSTAFGKNALMSNITGTDNVAVGDGALSSNIAGTFNTAVGTSALTTNNANGNTAIGFTALTTNSGGDNTAVGYQSLKANTSGIQNTAVGVNAMQQKTTGSANTAVGHSALNAVGTYNNATALGYQALLKNTASNVTGLGFQALAENTSGTSNTAVGFQTLAKNTTGSSNTAIGHLSLYNTNGATNNTAVGYNALFSNVTTASWNTAIGSNALRLINSNIAQNNTAVGSGALELGTGGILECVAIGSEAARNSFGNKCTAVGFGALRGDGGGSTGIDNVAIGNQSLRLNTTGQQNVALGNLAGNTITSGANNITIGHNAQVATATANNQIVIGAGGISTAFVNAPSWSYSSDRRLKSDIQDTALGLNFINKIRPVSYFRKDDVAQKTEFGFIAQELEIAFNEASVDSRGIISKTANGMYAVRYNDLLPITIKAVQEQQQQIDELKKANAELTKINAEILKRLEKLENN